MSVSVSVGYGKTRFYCEDIEELARKYRDSLRHYHELNPERVARTEAVLKRYLQRADFYDHAELASIHLGRFWVIPWWTKPKRIWMEVLGSKLVGDLRGATADLVSKISQVLEIEEERIQGIHDKLLEKVAHLKAFHEGHAQFFSERTLLKEIMVQGLTHVFFFTHHGKQGFQEHLEMMVERAFYFGASYMFDELLDESKISQRLKGDIQTLLDQALTGEDLTDFPIAPEYSQDEQELFNGLVFYAQKLQETLTTQDEDEREKLFNIYYGFNRYQAEERELDVDVEYEYEDAYRLHHLKSLYTLLTGAAMSMRDLPREELIHWIRLGEFGQISDDIEDVSDDLKDETLSCCTMRHGENSLHPTQMFVNSVADMLDHYPGSVRDLYMGYTLALDLSRTDMEHLGRIPGISEQFVQMREMIDQYRRGDRIERSFSEKVAITAELAYSSLRHVGIAFAIDYYEGRSWWTVFASSFSVLRSGCVRVARLWRGYQASQEEREVRLNIYEGLLKGRVGFQPQ